MPPLLKSVVTWILGKRSGVNVSFRRPDWVGGSTGKRTRHLEAQIIQKLLSGFQSRDDLLADLFLAFFGASLGQVWPVGKVSSWLV